MDENIDADAGKAASPVTRSRTFATVAVCVLTVAVVAIVLIATTEQGRFYSRFPSASWSEFVTIRDKALAGDAESQLFLGIFHANGQGLKQDYAEAAG